MGTTPIPGFAAGLSIPPKLLAAFVQCRDAAMGVIGDACMSLSSMKKAMSEKELYNTLCGIDRSWVLDHNFLCNHVEELLTANIEARVLDSIVVAGEDGAHPLLEGLRLHHAG